MTKKLKVTVDGKAYEVTVEMLEENPGSGTPLPAVSTVNLMASVPVMPPVAAAAAGNPGDIKSPLAGKVVAVSVQSGQDVKEGQQVMTLEAMKMNTYIYASKTGKI